MRRDVPPAGWTRPAAPPPEPPPPPAEPEQRSIRGTPWRPSLAPRGAGADWENSRRYFTLPSQAQWVQRMRDDPEVFTGILRDILRETRAERERRSGNARIGRRPKVIDGSLDELYAMITPRYSQDPFPKALQELVGSQSFAQFARRTGQCRRTLNRMISGEARLEMWRLERIAKACHVSPHYFREYRESYVLTVIAEMMAERPHLAIGFTRALNRQT